LEFPLTRVQIQRLDSGELEFGDPAQPDAFVYTYDPRVLEHPALREQASTRNQVDEIRGPDEVKKRLKLVGWFLAGFCVLAFIVWIVSGLFVRVAVAQIPPSIEEQFGEKVMKEVHKQMHLFKHAQLEAKLHAAADPLVAALPPTPLGYKFYLVDEDLPNAFALPGGNVLVTRGILDLCNRPEELAGVIAHEVAHVNQKHIFRKIASQVGPYVIFQILCHDDNTMMGTFGKGSEFLIDQSFSQEIELEADAVGWDYMVKARIDPRGMTDLFIKLKEEQERRPLSDIGLAAFSSHPATAKRIHVLEQKWEKLKDKQTFPPMDKGAYW